ncbi:hypothetical protein ATANTOWER_032618 [Ataeniobius toweri]|uniref:Uncharacterized protein n=1 Tax=Ataeniobius toweri TaxID=208326 RepID=A0ABU7BU99_9TELE|nr:hypothetical protein [Ataeniobius toweri]
MDGTTIKPLEIGQCCLVFFLIRLQIFENKNGLTDFGVVLIFRQSSEPDEHKCIIKVSCWEIPTSTSVLLDWLNAAGSWIWTLADFSPAYT